MGLFSGDTIIQVASTVYNLAGDEKDRPNYLKSLVSRNILSGTKDSLSQTLNAGYLNGPGIKLRQFYKWAEDNYTILGLPEAKLSGYTTTNAALIAPFVPITPGSTAWVQDATYGTADISFWVEQYILRNLRSRINDDYVVDVNDDTLQVTIDWASGPNTVFTPSDFDRSARYLYVYYTEVSAENILATRTGPVLALGDNQPNITGFTLQSQTGPTTVPVTLVDTTTVTKTYADGRPVQTTVSQTNEPTSYVQAQYVYSKDVRVSSTNPTQDRIELTRTTKTFIQNSEVRVSTTTNTTNTTENGVAVTIQTKVDNQYLAGVNTEQNVERDLSKTWSKLNLWIYRIGSGNALLDSLESTSGNYGGFFPFIPLRWKNNQIDATNMPSLYEQAKKGWKKASGSKWDSVSQKLLDNENIGDIDNAYVTFGVALNVKEAACQEYLWRFFGKLLLDQEGGRTAWNQYRAAEADYKSYYTPWANWKNGGGSQGNQREPYLPPKPVLGNNKLSFTSRALDVGYDVEVSWNFIDKSQGVGLGSPTAKVGDIWFTAGLTEVLDINIYLSDKDELSTYPPAGTKNIQTIRIWKQISATVHEYMDIVGLMHTNFVYGGKSVKTVGTQGILPGDTSPFIMPLHYGTLRDMPLMKSTQMATACVFLVLNSYEIVKQKWYETGFFKIIVVVVLAIVSVTLTGGAGLGILGTHMAVGSAIGLTGITAAIVGSIANSLAALVISTIIEKATVAVFGEAIGRLVAGVLTAFAAGGVMSFDIASGLSFNWGNIMRADVLMGMTDAVGQGIGGLVSMNIQSMAEEAQNVIADVTQKITDINEKFMEQFGYSQGRIDPLMFVSGSKGIRIESADSFLARTLMTGSDVVDVSLDMVSNFADNSKRLPDAFA